MWTVADAECGSSAKDLPRIRHPETVSVYIAVCRVSAKYYVGITRTPLRTRWIRHAAAARSARSQTAISRGIRKHGIENFHIWEVAVCFTRDAAQQIERELIVEYGCRAPQGYNLIAGGETGDQERNVTDETRAKQRAAQLRRYADQAERDRTAESSRGRQHSAETRQKMSELAIEIWQNRVLTDEQRQQRVTQSTGRKATDETRLKQSVARKGRKFTEEHKKNLSESRQGFKHSEETKRLQSVRALERWARKREAA